MKVSMLLATLNRRELMLNAIQSILCQNYQEFEIIVIDQSDVENSDIVELDSSCLLYTSPSPRDELV